MRIAQLQTKVFDRPIDNFLYLEKRVEETMEKKPDLIMFGEMFCCSYDTAAFPKAAEEEGGPLFDMLVGLAQKHHVYLAAGSVPEKDGEGHIYNTAYVFDREGKMIAKHRKMHLFDIDIRGGQYFKESDTLTAGDRCTVFDTEFGRMGLCICFDIRFPQLSLLMAKKGARMILVPASFNDTTGPAHWELLFRARAVDNQCFMAGTSVARDEKASYKAWGHSILVSPWGDIVGELDKEEGIMIHDIRLEEADRVRKELPVLSAKRTDCYELKDLKE